ncbi:MAG: ATP-binding protein [Candidatus Woesearchaeota archaeon]
MLEESKIREILGQWKAFWKKEIIHREIADKISKSISKEIIDLVGVRRSGKSTTLALIIKKLKLDEEDVLYVNFEDPAFVNYYGLELLDKIWEAYNIEVNPKKKPYLFFDEIQVIPRWEKWVRKIRDLELAHVFVTGSSSKLLSKEFGTALTGRHLSFTVYPLSFGEYIRFKGLKIPKPLHEKKVALKRALKSYLIGGGFPEVTLTGNQDLLKDYFEDILYKDIVLRHEIRDVNSLRKLANFCMTNISSPITYNSIKKQYGLSLDSVRSYLSYMEEAFLLFLVPVFSYSLKVQEFSPKKVYCIDNGLRNAVSFKFSKDEGKLAENLVFLELKRRGKEVYYWKGKNEVDFVLNERGGSLVAINVTYSDNIEKRELDSLKEFKDKFTNKAGRLILLTKDLEKKEGCIEFIPLWKWLSEGEA